MYKVNRQDKTRPLLREKNVLALNVVIAYSTAHRGAPDVAWYFGGRVESKSEQFRSTQAESKSKNKGNGGHGEEDRCGCAA